MEICGKILKVTVKQNVWLTFYRHDVVL